MISIVFWFTYFLIDKSHRVEFTLSSQTFLLLIPLTIAFTCGYLAANIIPIRWAQTHPYLIGALLVLFYSSIDLIFRNLIIRLLENLPLSQAFALALTAPLFAVITAGVYLIPAILLFGSIVGYLFSRFFTTI
jgi:hypothetical protein